MAAAERSIHRELDRVRRRWRRAVGLSIAAKIAALAAIVLASAALVDRVLQPDGAVSIAICAVAIVAVVAGACAFAWPFRRTPDDRRVARLIEERCPELEDEIAAAVDAGSRGGTTGFGPVVIERAARRLTQLDPLRVVAPETMRSGARRLGGAAAALLLAALFSAPLIERAVDAARRVGPRGSTAAAHGGAALVPPRVEAIDLHYDYPSFTSLAPRDEADGGDIYAPAGTRVRLRVRADRPIAGAQVALASGAASSLPVTRVDERTFESTLTLAGEGSYRASVADGHGLRGESVEYFIRLVADRPPEIHIVRPSGDQDITPLEEVTIEATADDDFGVAAMDMVFAVSGGPEHVVPFEKMAGTSTARAGSRLIAAETLGVKPGDVISYYARARDVPHAKPSTLAHSEMYFLEVKPFDEEYSVADSSAMSAATGTELAGLIAAQKEVISATWNLQRRGGAGHSEADARAVADAQAEVKTRTERAAASARPMRRRFGGMFQSASQPRGESSNSVAEAAAAMGRAVEHLDAGAMKEAMSPEMAALNALLKAEAEIRQRQIARQQNGSSTFGNGRQGQDLSSLFDRELKRQQRTNYETGSQVEQPSTQPDDSSALDRIRDLARRQEDLARRQQEASGLQEEERRRALERLTREQEELRRQLEEAAARQQQRSTAAGERGAGQASGAADAPMREALDEMRRAASELKRNAPGAAAERAARAAGQLRQAEGTLQGAGRDDAKGSDTRALADSLDALRQARDRLTRIERRLADLERERKAQNGNSGRKGSRGNSGQQGTADARGDAPSRGNAAGGAGDELQRAREQYAREVQRARELMGRSAQAERGTSGAAATPEEHEWSWGAPGTEAWKQDFGKWEALGKDVGRALERSESSVAGRLAKSLARDRLRAGASERVPDAYADRVARYYESLARGGGR